MKKFILRYFTYIAILYIVDKTVNGFEINNPSAMFIMAFIFTLTLIAIKPAIKFVTLPANFLTFGTLNFLTSIALLYMFFIIIPGLSIQTGSLGPVYSSDIQIPEVKLSMIGVIIISSFFISLFNNIINWTLDKKEKE